jgi:prolyl 4-hydroxylase
MSAALVRHELTEHVVTVDAFLSSTECDELLSELTYALWKPSRNYRRRDNNTFTSAIGDDRVSDTAHQDFFTDALVELLAGVEQKLQELFDVDVERLEWWQATRYRVDGMLGYHLDSGYWDDHYAGDRVRTFLLYLTTPAAGGGTHFRALDLLVEARAGRLVVWDDLFPDGRPNHSMIHAGAPVVAGEKVTLVTWERQRPFRASTSTSPAEKDEAANVGTALRA